MTINNTCFNPFPSSCALNSSFYSNNNSGWNGKGFRRCSQDTPVPQAKMYDAQAQKYWDSVEVPNGEVVPMGCEGMMNMMPQFNNDLFQCADGTVMNIKNGKILRNGNNNSEEYKGIRMIENPFERDNNGYWDDRKINSYNPQELKTGVSLSQDDIEYQRYSEKKNKELVDNLSQEQKDMLRDLENGKYCTKSKLIEESKNVNR